MFCTTEFALFKWSINWGMCVETELNFSTKFVCFKHISLSIEGVIIPRNSERSYIVSQPFDFEKNKHPEMIDGTRWSYFFWHWESFIERHILLWYWLVLELLYVRLCGVLRRKGHLECFWSHLSSDDLLRIILRSNVLPENSTLNGLFFLEVLAASS